MKHNIRSSAFIRLLTTPLAAGLFSLTLAENYGIHSFWYLIEISIISSLVVLICVYWFDGSRHADNIFNSSSFGMVIAFVILHFYPLGNWCVLSTFFVVSHINYVLLTILTFSESDINECNIVKRSMACNNNKL